MSDMRLIDANKQVDEGFLQDWYIHSVLDTDEPKWTDEHISELCNDFVIIPKESAKTAYDVDKVVEEIKANAQTMAEAKISDQPESYKGSDWSWCGHHYYKAISIHKCEEIVRRGGKERIVCFESGNKYYVNDERNNSFNNLVFADSPIEAAYKYCGKQVVRVGRNANCDLIVESKKGKYHYKISKY